MDSIEKNETGTAAAHQTVAARKPLLSVGIRAARANLVPGIALWVLATAVVLAYYFAPPARSFFEAVARLKSTHGYTFSITSTAIFAGLIPVLVSLARRNAARQTLSQMAFIIVFWGIKGFEIDTLYRIQAWLFGDSAEPEVVAVKVLVDQLVYCPFWAAPTMVLAYLFKDSKFNLTATRSRVGPHWYRQRVAPVLVSNWALWAPTVTCIYLLPEPLQLPLQNIVVCFWVLLVIFMTSEGERE